MIAIHTFVVVWMRKGAHNLKVAFLAITCTWLYVILYVVIASATKHSFYNPDPVSEISAVLWVAMILT